jgi:hypothetical protein
LRLSTSLAVFERLPAILYAAQIDLVATTDVKSSASHRPGGAFVRRAVLAAIFAYAIILAGCGTSTGNNNKSAINGNWTATLTNPDGAQDFSFTTTLTSTSSTGVTVSNFTFTTQSACFSGGTTATGAFTLTGTTSGVTSGGYQMTVQSVPPGNTLTLTGTLTNTTITGTWTLTGLTSGCAGSGNFTMIHS